MPYIREFWYYIRTFPRYIRTFWYYIRMSLDISAHLGIISAYPSISESFDIISVSLLKHFIEKNSWDTLIDPNGKVDWAMDRYHQQLKYRFFQVTFP